MKKVLAIAVLVVAGVCAGQAQDVTGDWMGSLQMGMGQIRIVLHVTKAADGTLKATLDSPDQGVVGMPVESITLEGSKLKFTANVVKGSYEGTVKNGSTINGNWSQPKKLPLDFKKTTETIKLQHPAAPPSDIDGTWEGEATLPSLADTPSRGKLRLTYHIKNTGDGLTGTFDEPDMSIKGWPVVAVIRKGSSIKIETPQLGGAFIGKINKDNTVMSGDWNNGITYALTLKRSKEAASDAQAPAAAAPQNH